MALIDVKVVHGARGVPGKSAARVLADDDLIAAPTSQALNEHLIDLATEAALGATGAVGAVIAAAGAKIAETEETRLEAQAVVDQQVVTLADIAARQADVATKQGLTAEDRETTQGALADTLSALALAQAAADAAMFNGEVYPDTASGLAATTEGEYFLVAGGGAVFAIRYRNVSGVATNPVEYASKAAVDAAASAFAQISQDAAYNQYLIDSADLIWIEAEDPGISIETVLTDGSIRSGQRSASGERIEPGEDATRQYNQYLIDTADLIWIEAEDSSLLIKEVLPDGKILTGTGADGRQIAGGGSASVQPLDAVAYVESGVLRAQGPGRLDRVLNSILTWVRARCDGQSVVAQHTSAYGPQLKRVPLNGSSSLYPTGFIFGVIQTGQSTAEGEAGNAAAARHPNNPYPGRLLMPRTAANNVWMGQTTTGGVSLELADGYITGLTDLRDVLADASHGTTSGVGACLYYMALADRECEGWTPKMLLLHTAEGGQDIADLLPTAPSNRYAYRNTLKGMLDCYREAQEVGEMYIPSVVLMGQGQADTSDAALGTKHELIRSSLFTDFYAALEIEPLGPLAMVSTQESSFLSNSGGVRSILDRHIDTVDNGGHFYCLGPSYAYGWSNDYLHNTSLGYDDEGDMQGAFIASLETTGTWEVLRAVRVAGAWWTVTGAHELTVRLSKPAEISTAEVAAIANAGVEVEGGAVTGVDIDPDVDDRNLKITVAGDPHAVTAIRLALTGQTFPTRTEAAIPRSNIRTASPVGTHRSNGRPMHQYLCHQRLA